MQVRHYLETSLQQAIIENEGIAVIHPLIKLIQKSPKALLSSFDTEGRSFLHLALENDSLDVFNKLLELQKDDYATLFAKNKNGQSLLHISVAKGNDDTTSRLIDLALAKNNLATFLKPDCNGDTVLHLAAGLTNTDTLELLTKKLIDSKHWDGINNAINSQDETALHIALTKHINKSVALLINLDAKINIFNHERKTSFDLISELPQTDQIKIFCSLNKPSQLVILQKYRNLLIHDPKNKIKKIYFDLCSRHSLQRLLYARMEFDDAMPIRNFYKEDAVIPADILKKMPLYKQKIIAAVRQSNDMKLIEDTLIQFNTTTSQLNHSKSVDDDSLDSDHIQLTHLINI